MFIPFIEKSKVCTSSTVAYKCAFLMYCIIQLIPFTILLPIFFFSFKFSVSLRLSNLFQLHFSTLLNILCFGSSHQIHAFILARDIFSVFSVETFFITKSHHEIYSNTIFGFGYTSFIVELNVRLLHLVTPNSKHIWSHIIVRVYWHWHKFNIKSISSNLKMFDLYQFGTIWFDLRPVWAHHKW